MKPWFLLLVAALCGSCRHDFLEPKSDSHLLVPQTLEDFQSLLDHYYALNETGVLGELSADNYYLATTAALESLPLEERNAYLWKPDLFEGKEGIRDWNSSFQQVFYANVVLEGLPKVPRTPSNASLWDELKGRALFVRGFAYFNLTQLFTPPYAAGTAQTALGLPLRTTPGVDRVEGRASLAATYAFLEEDLKAAVPLLPAALPPRLRNRASRPAAQALLARVYLSQRRYAEALAAADAALSAVPDLLDFAQPFPATDRANRETLYQACLSFTSTTLAGLIQPTTRVDSVLFRSYGEGDRRKTAFFDTTTGAPTLLYNYSGTILPFSGLATDEVYLIKAECLAREGRVEAALQTLNYLLQTRWERGLFVPYTAATPGEALEVILTERRKELPFRGLRWSDLRRLNEEGRGLTLHRVVEGVTYTLPPRSPLYVFPIPPEEVRASGLAPNPR